MKKKPCQGQQGHMYHNLYQSKKRECGEGGGLLIVPDQMHGFLEALKQRGMYGGRGGGGGALNTSLPMGCLPPIMGSQPFNMLKTFQSGRCRGYLGLAIRLSIV